MSRWLFYEDGEQVVIEGKDKCRNCDLCEGREVTHCDYYLDALESGLDSCDAQTYAAIKSGVATNISSELRKVFYAIDMSRRKKIEKKEKELKEEKRKDEDREDLHNLIELRKKVFASATSTDFFKDEDVTRRIENWVKETSKCVSLRDYYSINAMDMERLHYELWKMYDEVESKSNYAVALTADLIREYTLYAHCIGHSKDGDEPHQKFYRGKARSCLLEVGNKIHFLGEIAAEIKANKIKQMSK